MAVVPHLPTTSAPSQTFPQALLMVSRRRGFIESIRSAAHHDTFIGVVFSAFAEKCCPRVEKNRPGNAWPIAVLLKCLAARFPPSRK